MDELKRQVKAVIEYSQCIPDAQVDELLDRWLDAKKEFIGHFGGPIYEHPTPIHIHLSDNQKYRKILDFEEYISNTFDNGELANFIDLNKESFFHNLVDKEGMYGSLGVKKGMKLVKAFKFFEKDKEVLYKLQSMASQIIQEDKIEGQLCFSVHPLDYLSISCNTYNWRSCHALDGEYRAGNLSYMVDKATIVVYIKSEKDTMIPFFPPEVPWNSKKWRVLWYFDDLYEIIFAGKQYPFESHEGLEVARDIFLRKFFKAQADEWCAWTDPIVDYVEDSYGFKRSVNDKRIIMRGDLRKLTDVINDGDGALQFNDVLRSSSYVPHYTAFRNYSYYPQYQGDIIRVGGKVKCLHCGQEYISNSNTMRCDDCELKYGTEVNDEYAFCVNCDTRLYAEEAYWDGDDAICPHCYEKYYFTCEDCEDVYPINEQKYDKFNQEYLCLCCYEDRYPEEEEE